MGFFSGTICASHYFPSQALTAPDDSDEARAYDEVTHLPKKAEISHEFIGAAAAYYASTKYEDYVAENGRHPHSSDKKQRK